MQDMVEEPYDLVITTKNVGLFLDLLCQQLCYTNYKETKFIKMVSVEPKEENRMLRKVAINFDWEYCRNFHEMGEGSFETVNIPHANTELPFNNFNEKDYQFESYYRKKITIDGLVGQRVHIRFEGVMAYAKVYLNDVMIGEHKGGYTPFEFDLTDHVEAQGDYVLGVYVDSRERDDIPPFGHVIDYLTFGGIYREVALIYTGECFVKDVFLQGVDVLTEPKLSVQADLFNVADGIRQVHVNLRLLDGDCTVYSDRQRIDLEDNDQQKLIMISNGLNIELWSIDSPKLYTVELTVIEDGGTQDIYQEHFGFRSFEFKGDGFYQNGRPLKIVGLNRHQSFPYVGYAMPMNPQRKDADILKYELCVNTVRLSHYPQSTHFLDRCDEIGLLVFNEIPGWQHIGDDDWKEVAVRNVEEMILRDRNRPSIFIWGTRINESNDDHDFYRKTQSKAKELDQTRMTGGVRCIKNSELLEDVYTYNDFSHVGNNDGLEQPTSVFKNKKPYLVTEHNGHMYPTKKFDDEKHRVEQALRHMNVLESAYKYKDISGAIGWCMFDYNTHKDFGSGDRICYHGVMDMNRIPKMAAYTYQSQHAEEPVLHVGSSMNIGDYAGGFLTQVHVFTNCDYIKLYSKGRLIKAFYPDRATYPNVPHPPIVMDDFIGDQLEEDENFSSSDSDLVKKLLMKANRTGGRMNLYDKMRLGYILLKYKMTYLDAENLYTKYFGGWGGEASAYRIEGYIHGALVKTVTKGQFSKAELEVTADRTELIEEATYDATRILVRLIDEFGHEIPYAWDAFTLRTSDHLELIGPDVGALVGGSTGLWVKTTGLSGEGWISISSPRFGDKRLKIRTRCQRRTV